MPKLEIKHILGEQSEVLGRTLIKHSLQDLQILVCSNMTPQQINTFRQEFEDIIQKSEHLCVLTLPEGVKVGQLEFESSSTNGGYLCPECGNEMILESQNDLIRTYSKFHCDKCQIELTKWLSDKETR